MAIRSGRDQIISSSGGGPADRWRLCLCGDNMVKGGGLGQRSLGPCLNHSSKEVCEEGAARASHCPSPSICVTNTMLPYRESPGSKTRPLWDPLSVLGWILGEEVEKNMAAFPVVERCLRSCSVAGTDSKKTHMHRKEEKLLPIILSGDENKDKTKENKHHPVKIVRM